MSKYCCDADLSHLIKSNLIATIRKVFCLLTRLQVIIMICKTAVANAPTALRFSGAISKISNCLSFWSNEIDVWLQNVSRPLAFMKWVKVSLALSTLLLTVFSISLTQISFGKRRSNPLVPVFG